MSPAEIGLLVGQILAGGSGLGAIIIVLVNKKARTPADDQARIAFGVSILEKQLERSQQDAQRWLEVERYLRERIERAEGEAEEARTLLEKVSEQARVVTAERDELQKRIAKLAAMHTRNEPITLEDILGTQTIPVQAIA